MLDRAVAQSARVVKTCHLYLPLIPGKDTCPKEGRTEVGLISIKKLIDHHPTKALPWAWLGLWGSLSSNA